MCNKFTLLQIVHGQVSNVKLKNLKQLGTLFDSGQQTLLYDEIIRPEGRIYFAVEHAFLYQAWIQGAIESGLRTANALKQDLTDLTRQVYSLVKGPPPVPCVAKF